MTARERASAGRPATIRRSALHPHDRSGTEPLTARSPLRLRLVMSIVAAAVAVVVGISLLAAGTTGPVLGGVLCLVVAAVAVVDAIVVARRLHHGDTG